MKAESGSEFRSDVEGMRAVAVGLVLLYHGGLPLVRGGYVGVDVFFVISGFLITGMLVREVQKSGTVSLARFYARRAKRLLPAAALVLVTTAALVWAFVPRLDRAAFGGDVAAAAVYVVNWRLAGRSVDYLAEDIGVSPVQHFWSLAVEEQFYIVWPLLLLAVAWWVRRRRWSVRAAMALGLSLVAVPSLVWSIVATAREPTAAFFVSTTRMWELAIGGFVAIAAPALARLPRAPSAVAGWLGLAAVVASALVVTADSAWPGYAALWPTLATAVVIGTGPAAGQRGPVRLLGLPPMIWIGGLSYSLYLWHWPLLVIASARFGPLGAGASLAVLGVATVAAWLAYALVEDPARNAARMTRSPRFALLIGGALSLAGLTAGLAVVQLSRSERRDAPAVSAPGAAVLAEDPRGDAAGRPVDAVDWFVPDPVDAPQDVPVAYGDNCQVGASSSKPVTCVYGDPHGKKTLALVGDSKVLQWLPALQAIAPRRGWKLVTYTKSACAFTAAMTPFKKPDDPYESCAAWNQKTLARLLRDRPDAVLTSHGKQVALVDGKSGSRAEGIAAMADGLHRQWQALLDRGIAVAVLSDTPRPSLEVAECVAENRTRLTQCAFERAPAVEKGAAEAQRKAVDMTPGVRWIDLNDAICPTERCAPVIGHVLVYRQGSHVTATYMKTLAPRLEAALLETMR